MLYRIPARDIGRASCEPIGLGHPRVSSTERTAGLFCPSCKHVFETDYAAVRAGVITCTECGDCRMLTTLERQLLAIDR